MRRAPRPRSAGPAYELVNCPSFLFGKADPELPPAPPLGFRETEDTPRDELLEARPRQERGLADAAGPEHDRVSQQRPGSDGAESLLLDLPRHRAPVQQHEPLWVGPAPLDPDQ